MKRRCRGFSVAVPRRPLVVVVVSLFSRFQDVSDARVEEFICERSGVGDLKEHEPSISDISSSNKEDSKSICWNLLRFAVTTHSHVLLLLFWSLPLCYRTAAAAALREVFDNLFHVVKFREFQRYSRRKWMNDERCSSWFSNVNWTLCKFLCVFCASASSAPEATPEASFIGFKTKPPLN